MNDLDQTVALIKQSYLNTAKGIAPDVAKDFNLSLDLVPFNLETGARLLFPVFSPIRNMMPRTKGHGTSKRFKAITAINNANALIFAQEGVSGATVQTTTVDVTIGYVSMGLKDFVTLEAQMQGEGQIDARATAAANLLRAFMIEEEKAILWGQGNPSQATSAGGVGVSIGGALGTSPQPTLAASGTGSSLAAATWDVVQVSNTGMGGAKPSTTATVVTTAGEDVVITPTPTAGQPVLSYTFYFKLSTDANYVVLTTNGAPVTVSSYAAGSTPLPAANDNSYSSLAFNGILPQMTATGSGSYVKALNAVMQMSDIDNLLINMWRNAKADPDRFYCEGQEILRITNQTLGAGGTPYFLVVKDQDSATANYRVSRLVNKITGSEIKVDVHPYLPQGNLLALSTKMPQWYPGSNIPSVWTMDMVLDYTQLESNWAASPVTDC